MYLYLYRSRCHSAHRGGLELGTGTGTYGACRSTQCCVAMWPRWVESTTRLSGFRALKKTPDVPEAPYPTKVNYRWPTSRGTTPPQTRVSFPCHATRCRARSDHAAHKRASSKQTPAETQAVNNRGRGDTRGTLILTVVIYIVFLFLLARSLS